MVNVIFSGKSESDLNLLIALAKKIGIKTHVLNQEELEDLGLGFAMKEGKTGEYVDNKDFLKQLKDGN
ncbi:MAG: hypothetical protein AAGI38_16000 [Bacteroidota bacterium]